ncbi:MAG: P-II family nitrogen regulator [Clostridia bacterium]|nr:P-II family nitrogen regulator [Clostridia bacterium]
MKEYEAIFFILNKGYVDEAMEAARAAGARGGTIINGRGTADPEEMIRKLGISVQAEKELLLILAEKGDKTAIMKAISAAAGLNKAGGGIGFSVPVEDTVGLSAED